MPADLSARLAAALTRRGLWPQCVGMAVTNRGQRGTVLSARGRFVHLSLAPNCLAAECLPDLSAWIETEGEAGPALAAALLAAWGGAVSEPLLSDCPPWMAHVAPRWRSGETRRAWLRAHADRDPVRCDRCGRSGLPPTPSGLPPRWQARERKVLCWACK